MGVHNWPLKREVDFSHFATSLYLYNLWLLEEQKLEVAEAKQEKKNEGPKKCSTLEEARHRNSELIKSLEVAKARLRSRATYSPIESILQKAVRAYEKEMSLVPYRKPNDIN